MPITSTAIIAKKFKAESIYYDPYDWVNRNDPALSDIKCLNTDQIDSFVKKIL